jgi:Histidine kinase
VVTPNSFIEDTSVLVAGTFLLVRGSVEQYVKRPQVFGAMMGVLGVSESIFPSSRFPYAPHTLAIGLAGAFSGLAASTVTWLSIVGIGIATLSPHDCLVEGVQASCVFLLVALSHRYSKSLVLQGAAMGAGSAIGLSLTKFLGGSPTESLTSYWTIPANLFAFATLSVVINDAIVRSQSTRLRIEAQQSRQLAAEANYANLRSRVHPHFLFNVLNSIAALCTISPKEASEVTVELGRLMRRSLEMDLRQGISIREEMVTVQSYLGIEMKRFPGKFSVDIDVKGFEELVVPAYSIQTLVENAILHGVSRKSGPGKVCISVRKTSRFVSIRVVDDGFGLSPGKEYIKSDRGLGILRAQLKLDSRYMGTLHLVGRPKGGAIVAFKVRVQK